MSPKTISTVSEFIDSIKTSIIFQTTPGYHCWFRAENTKHIKTCLIPNIFREFIKDDISLNSNFIKKDISLRNIFSLEAYPLLIQNQLLENDLGTSFIMQHYGCHTRLLDWTENALISLFFAVEDTESNQDSIIWILDPLKLNSLTNKIVNDITIDEFRIFIPTGKENELLKYFDVDLLKGEHKSVKYPIAIKPFYIDERMKSQLSCFTLFGYDPQGINKHPYKEKFLDKLLVPSDSFKKIKRELYELGISYDIIYPGLEGTSKKIVYAFDEQFF